MGEPETEPRWTAHRIRAQYTAVVTSLFAYSWGDLWAYFTTALAVIGLVDLTGELVKWAALIHWLAIKYAVLRSIIFGWLPFHIPPEWHDYVVLSCIMFSVTNVGFYRRTGHFYFMFVLLGFFSFFVFLTEVTNNDPKMMSKVLRLIEEKPARGFAARLDNAALVLSFACSFCVAILLTVYLAWIEVAAVWGGEHVGIMFLFRYTAWLWPIALIGATGAFIAWRWIITTSLIFSVLVFINTIYVAFEMPERAAATVHSENRRNPLIAERSIFHGIAIIAGLPAPEPGEKKFAVIE